MTYPETPSPEYISNINDMAEAMLGQGWSYHIDLGSVYPYSCYFVNPTNTTDKPQSSTRLVSEADLVRDIDSFNEPDKRLDPAVHAHIGHQILTQMFTKNLTNGTISSYDSKQPVRRIITSR
ncbi:hypothetical protein KC867_01910 [Candidatus Saccharibacteria bacterium]|nr:hypothetical protein [Candidatus Saccharibacteria bacterium]